MPTVKAGFVFRLRRFREIEAETDFGGSGISGVGDTAFAAGAISDTAGSDVGKTSAGGVTDAGLATGAGGSPEGRGTISFFLHAGQVPRFPWLEFGTVMVAEQ